MAHTIVVTGGEKETCCDWSAQCVCVVAADDACSSLCRLCMIRTGVCEQVQGTPTSLPLLYIDLQK